MNKLYMTIKGTQSETILREQADLGKAAAAHAANEWLPETSRASMRAALNQVRDQAVDYLTGVGIFTGLPRAMAHQQATTLWIAVLTDKL